MTKTQIAKNVANIVVGSSVYWTTRTVIRNNVLPQTRIQKAKAEIGGIVAGTVAVEYSDRWTDKKIDSIVNWWTENVTKTSQS